MSRRISSDMAARIASRTVMVTISVPSGISGSFLWRPYEGGGAATGAGVGSSASEQRLVLARALNGLADHRDGRIHFHILGAFGHENGGQRPLIDGFHFHGGLVGFDLGQHVAGLDIVTDFFQPFGKLALFHGGRQGGHQNVRHVGSAS